MAERGFHLKRAEHHYAAYQHLLATPQFHDWAVVALFYSALHLVDAALDGEPLSKDERHPRKHSAPGTPANGGRGRSQLVAQEFPSINREYRSLREASERTRYDIEKLGAGTLQRLHDQYQRIKTFTAMRTVAQASLPNQAP